VIHASDSSRTPEASQIVATIEDPRMEMGRNRNGFHSWLPRTQAGYDYIWVIVDRLTKVAHFIPVKTTYYEAKLVELYMSQIVCLHGVSKKIVSNRGSQSTSKFWEKLHESMDTKINFSSTYHTRTEGQTERTNQILEYMFRACALKYEKRWDKSLPYTKFLYNNSYQASIEMAPFQALYGWLCRTPLFWSQTGESQVFGPEVLRDVERQVQMIRENSKVEQSRQKRKAIHASPLVIACGGSSSHALRINDVMLLAL
jgi:hypothetical protein